VTRRSDSVKSEEVPLTGVAAEFRTALREEIEAARRSPSSGDVSLISGRRIAQVGGAYQYVFDIENALNRPADMPGDLFVDGRKFDVTLISVDGLTITLSVPEDLGAFVPSARLRTDLTFLLRRLIERIEAWADRPNPAGDRILGRAPISGEPASLHLSEDDLNPRQQEAVASSLGRDTTFIWGPPGTGKTTTIGVIAQQLYRAGRSVLLVSHTNVAVDGALLKIGEALDATEFEKGLVVRVGEPRDARLRDHHPELLLDTHVDRREKELSQRRDALNAERDATVARIVELSRKIEIREWLDEASNDLDAMSRHVGEVRNLEAALEQVRNDHRRLEASSEYWATAADEGRNANRNLAARSSLTKRLEELERRVSALQHLRATSAQELSDAESLLAEAEALAPLRARARQLPSAATQTQEVERARAVGAEARKLHAEATVNLAHAEAVYSETSSVGRLKRLWRGLPTPEDQGQVVEALRSRLDSATHEMETAENALRQAEDLLSEVATLAEQLRPHARVPEVDTQRIAVAEARKRLEDLDAQLGEANRSLLEAQAEAETLSAKIESFIAQYSTSPDEVLRQADAHAAELTRLESLESQRRQQCIERRRHLEPLLSQRLAALRQWGLTSKSPISAEAMLAAIRTAYESALAEVQGDDLRELRAERSGLNQHIRTLESEINSIEETLKRVEGLVIAEAMVVATTLTRAYLRDDIQSRRFDTVILDEASIAPIPALWVAASLADKNAVVVGDFKQLPPIVLSQHDLAQKWLGHDIFKEAGLASYGADAPHLVKLRRQYRMHPDISAVPNALIYGNILEDDPEKTSDDGNLSQWYQGPDDAVLLVDTGPLGAWVTGVPRGRGASRLNFLSATISVDIACQLLREQRPPWERHKGPRVLTVSPYRAHTALLRLLLEEEGLLDEVLPGTVHSFQGSEADVVIFDLVNDEPHWRVGMFNPAYDENTKRLLNVALTRARRRLIVVGDLDYIAKRAKKAFLGAELIPFLQQQRYPRRNAQDIVPSGLAARAARTQLLAFGGDVEPDAARLVLTQAQGTLRYFYAILCGDLRRAKRQILIYSAFITQSRLAMLEPHLRAAVEGDKKVYVVTKPLRERRKAEVPQYRILEQALADWGLVVIHKRNMHEKLIFVDDHILWVGSLNPLSFAGNTQEHMERRDNRKVFSDYARKLRLDELVGAYDEGHSTCPVCESEMLAAEGRDARGLPFYWYCPQCRYSRDIDTPPPAGGMIDCPRCGAKVEYGEWGGKPAWRCVANRHHHQKVRPAHLRLPKMRALIPPRELQKLDKQFGTGPSAAPGLFGRGPP